MERRGNIENDNSKERKKENVRREAGGEEWSGWERRGDKR